LRAETTTGSGFLPKNSIPVKAEEEEEEVEEVEGEGVGEGGFLSIKALATEGGGVALEAATASTLGSLLRKSKNPKLWGVEVGVGVFTTGVEVEVGGAFCATAAGMGAGAGTDSPSRLVRSNRLGVKKLKRSFGLAS